MSHLFQNTKLQLFIIALFTILAYSNILQNGFAADDNVFILNWENKKHIENWQLILKGDGPARHTGLYRPVRGMFYLVYHQLFAENPLGYHLHSILVHLASTILVYFIVREFIRGPVRRHPQSTSLSFGLLRTAGSHWGAPTPATPHKLTLLPFISSLLFGLHPIHTESITFMTSAMDMTGVVFMLTSFYLYILTTGPVSSVSRQLSSQSLIINHKSLIIASCLFALLAFFTYEPTLSLVLLVPAYKLIFSDFGNWRKFLRATWAYFAAAFAFLVVRIVMLGRNPVEYKYLGDSFYHTQLLVAKAFLLYLKLLVVPAGLSINHILGLGFETFSPVVNSVPAFKSQTITDAQVLLAILVVILTLVCVYKLHKHKIFVFSIAWFLISLLPFLSIVPQPTILSERYLYIPSLGFVLLISFLLVKARDYLQQVQSLKFKVKNYSAKLKILNFNLSSVISEGKSLLILHFTLLILVSFYFLQTYQRNKDWKDNKALWQSTARVYPKSAFARYVLARDAFERGDKDTGRQFYFESIGLNKNFIWTYLNLGNSYYEQKEFDKALEILKKGVRAEVEPLDLNLLEPLLGDLSKIYSLMGMIYRERGEDENAFVAFQQALSADFRNAEAIKNVREMVDLHPEFREKFNETFFQDWQFYQGAWFSFFFPKNWILEESKIVKISSPDRSQNIEFERIVYKNGLESFLKDRQEKFGIISKERFTTLPGFEKVYVKVWNDGNVPKLEFFIDRGGSMLRVFVYPSKEESKVIFDNIIRTVKFNT